MKGVFDAFEKMLKHKKKGSKRVGLKSFKSHFLTRGDRITSTNDKLWRYFFDPLELKFFNETSPVATLLPTWDLRKKIWKKLKPFELGALSQMLDYSIMFIRYVQWAILASTKQGKIYVNGTWV